MLPAVAAPPQFDNLEQHVVFECVIFYGLASLVCCFCFRLVFPHLKWGFITVSFWSESKLEQTWLLLAVACVVLRFSWQHCRLVFLVMILTDFEFVWMVVAELLRNFWLIFAIFNKGQNLNLFFFANWFKFENSRFCPNGTSGAEPLPSFDQLKNKIVVFDLNVIFESPVWNLT